MNQGAVIVVGDSYIQSLARMIPKPSPGSLHEMRVNAVNLGVLGYGTDQELLTLEAFLESHPALDVRDIIVFVSQNDFIDVQLDDHYLVRASALPSHRRAAGPRQLPAGACQTASWISRIFTGW